MADTKIKNITAVDVLEDSNDKENVMVEFQGGLKRLPISKIKGSGGGSGSGAGLDLAIYFTQDENEDFSVEIYCPSFKDATDAIQERPLCTAFGYRQFSSDGIMITPYEPQMIMYMDLTPMASEAEQLLPGVNLDISHFSIQIMDMSVEKPVANEWPIHAMIMYATGTIDPGIGFLINPPFMQG